jgi:acetolactate decarboxylase
MQDSAPVLDERLIANLHVHALRLAEAHADREPHVLFQASTIAALLDGAYEGDLTFAELAEHGDLGLGTLNGLDGEMIALDGRFYRADVEGSVNAVSGSARTPFAVVVAFEAAVDVEVSGEDLEARLADAGATCAVRFDAEFELVRARSVPRQQPPYRPLAEVAAEQHVFELREVRGTLVGFRFPDYASGLEVPGYHLHFITDDRRRGGHVLDFRARAGRLRLDLSSDLHVELPPGVELGAGHLDEEELERIERGG